MSKTLPILKYMACFYRYYINLLKSSQLPCVQTIRSFTLSSVTLSFFYNKPAEVFFFGITGNHSRGTYIIPNSE
ncbi:hypothetical protein VIGAN_10226100 [Vigna angularis var. angularis]|uniref:Uncharacterized protein n=1 Tax=Vigna angularis var. angularis TaxID=157739 RepID=A0A0S3T5Z6_PHAAN|nr:hypothetical protein VIGAN_10226100 [Vigna angularis var. angularis]